MRAAGLHLTGHFGLEHYRAGSLIDSRSVRNTIVNDGLAAVAGLIIQTGSTSPFTYLAIGTSTTAVSSTDTALYGELTTGGGQRSLATLSRVTTDVTNDTAQLVHTFTFTTTGTYPITEAGVFNVVTTSSGSGAMLCRQIFTAINVVNTDTLEITYKLDVD
jgi:hypothetical protein